MTESAVAPEPATTPAYRSNQGLTRGLKFLIGFAILLNGFDFVFRFLEYRLLESMASGAFASVEEQMAAANASDMRVQASAIVNLVVFIVLLIVLLVWVYRANRNAKALGAADMKYSPGLAAGCFFIPFFNLVMPYRALQEIWRASGTDADWKTSRRLAAVGWWWGLWLASAILAQYATILTKRVQSIPQAESASVAYIVQIIIETLAYIALLTMIVRIAARQEQKANIASVF